MSFYPIDPLDKTIGTAYEAFHYNVPSGMLPQAAYKARAAGPVTLTGGAMHGLGRVYGSELRSQVPANLQGFGQVDVLTPVVNTLMATAGVQNALAGIVTMTWPMIQTNMDQSLKPIKILMGVTAGAAVAAAIFSYLLWDKS